MQDYNTLITNGHVVLKDSVQPLSLGIKAKLGKVLALHAESTPIVELLQQESADDSVSGPDDYAASRPVEAAIEAVQRALSFANITGCPLSMQGDKYFPSGKSRLSL